MKPLIAARIMCLVCLVVGRLSGADVQSLLETRIAEQEAGKAMTEAARTEWREGVRHYLDEGSAKYSDYLDRWPVAEQGKCLMIYAKLAAVDSECAHYRFSRFPSIAAAVAFLQKEPAINNTAFGLHAIAMGECSDFGYNQRGSRPAIEAYHRLRSVNPYLADCLLRFLRSCPAYLASRRAATAELLACFQPPAGLQTATTNAPGHQVASAMANGVSLPPVEVFAGTVPFADAVNRTHAAEIVILNLMSEKGSAGAALSSYLWSVPQLATPVSNCGGKLPGRTIRIYTVVCPVEEQPQVRAFCAGLANTNNFDACFPLVCFFLQGKPIAVMRGKDELKASSPAALWVVEKALRALPPRANP